MHTLGCICIALPWNRTKALFQTCPPRNDLQQPTPDQQFGITSMANLLVLTSCIAGIARRAHRRWAGLNPALGPYRRLRRDIRCPAKRGDLLMLVCASLPYTASNSACKGTSHAACLRTAAGDWSNRQYIWGRRRCCLWADQHFHRKKNPVHRSLRSSGCWNVRRAFRLRSALVRNRTTNVKYRTSAQHPGSTRSAPDSTSTSAVLDLLPRSVVPSEALP